MLPDEFLRCSLHDVMGGVVEISRLARRGWMAAVVEGACDSQGWGVGDWGASSGQKYDVIPVCTLHEMSNRCLAPSGNCSWQLCHLALWPSSLHSGIPKFCPFDSLDFVR